MFPPSVETQGDTLAQCFSVQGSLHSSKILKALCQAGLSLGELPAGTPCGTVFPALPQQRGCVVGERFSQDLLSAGGERLLQWGVRWGDLRTAWSDLHRIKSL